MRLMLTLTPCVCVLAAIAFSHTYEKFLLADDRDEQVETNKLSRKESGEVVDGDAAKGGGVAKSLYDKVSLIVPINELTVSPIVVSFSRGKRRRQSRVTIRTQMSWVSA